MGPTKSLTFSRVFPKGRHDFFWNLSKSPCVHHETVIFRDYEDFLEIKNPSLRNPTSRWIERIDYIFCDSAKDHNRSRSGRPWPQDHLEFIDPQGFPRFGTWTWCSLRTHDSGYTCRYFMPSSSNLLCYPHPALTVQRLRVCLPIQQVHTSTQLPWGQSLCSKSSAWWANMNRIIALKALCGTLPNSRAMRYAAHASPPGNKALLRENDGLYSLNKALFQGGALGVLGPLDFHDRWFA